MRISKLRNTEWLTPISSSLFEQPILSAEDCDELISFFRSNEKYQTGGTVMSNFEQVQNEKRVVKVLTVNQIRDDQSGLIKLFDTPLFSKLLHYIDEVNQQFYRFDVQNISQVEIAQYSSTNSGHYDAHIDNNVIESLLDCRKLSFSVLLSEPSEFSGGELKFEFCGNTFSGSNEDLNGKKLRRGDVLVFPSFLTHQVTPVTFGNRYVMFGWINGPRFK
jgi:PKHD-type hydroxylase